MPSIAALAPKLHRYSGQSKASAQHGSRRRMEQAAQTEAIGQASAVGVSWEKGSKHLDARIHYLHLQALLLSHQHLSVM